MNFLLQMAFNGGQYHGFQVQANAVTICEVLQNSMEKVLGYRPDVKGCSRTDSGVHAAEYCISFKSDTTISPRKMPLAFNRYLPPDIRVYSARQVPEDFHARYSALGKQYDYIFLNSPVDDPFAPGQYYRVFQTLDIKAMQKAASYFVGKQDFASFMSAGSDIEDTVRTVTDLQILKVKNRVIVRISADGFLYNMVRIIAGTLLNVGCGRTNPEEIPAIIQGKNRSLAGDTMPAKGLFLKKVYYSQSSLEIK